MKNVYLPIEDFNDYACYVIYDKDTIRAYENTPRINSTSDYTDFFINSHYMERKGTQTWGNYNTNLPVCVNKSVFTNEIYYSNDMPAGMFMFCVLFFFIIYFPYRIMRRILGRWLVI